ncbi:response regulator [Solilutibacter silvestris]|uniref:Response regulator consisting of a CheY-like receiver domain and a winged-helix DNA-binding domain n=1 Tax=Solilutibacter silvestris TaxID=1645665 RepID=A0A2K1Q0Z5_9GAMM|nr:response regulator [Lysobacter silvestris]PNS08700.1 Response regulator consisting of a CheY-like receiver domain and a winged-helix DNA-binding domain [Lysobacter silvestris]
MRILIVEDNQPLAEWLARGLRQSRYIVDCLHDGAQADHVLSLETYDLVVLDLGLPRLGGQDVLRRLRARGNDVPVIILTANNSLEGRIGGLDIGADDYLAKPFEMVELEARMRALLRRSTGKKNPTLACGTLTYDSNTQAFSIAGQDLELTPREHAVLVALVMQAGKTVSKRTLATTLATLDGEVSIDAIEIYVHRLRRKIEASDAMIATLRGLGYLLRQRDAG